MKITVGDLKRLIREAASDAARQASLDKLERSLLELGFENLIDCEIDSIRTGSRVTVSFADEALSRMQTNVDEIADQLIEMGFDTAGAGDRDSEIWVTV